MPWWAAKAGALKLSANSIAAASRTDSLFLNKRFSFCKGAATGHAGIH